MADTDDHRDRSKRRRRPSDDERRDSQAWLNQSWGVDGSINIYADSGGSQPLRRASLDEYTVGWVCALHIEAAAAAGMLDDICERDRPGPDGDPNIYTLGRIGQHNVAIACLPGFYGTSSAANVATHMARSFKSLRYRLLVGIGGGVPGDGVVRLGDVVVGLEVVQFDMGKVDQDGKFRSTGGTSRPPVDLLTAVNSLRTLHESQPNRIADHIREMVDRNPGMDRYAYKDELRDWLFGAESEHVDGADDCLSCSSTSSSIPRARDYDDPKIHYGVVASGNQVMRHGRTRDEWSAKLNAVCFEMEAAGLQFGFPCLTVRGICDYADSHKNKQWQPYAAATAAAYAKELLSLIPAVESQLPPLHENPSTRLPRVFRHHREVLFQSLRFEQLESRYFNIRGAFKKTCEWFLRHPTYLAWQDPAQLDSHHGVLWIKGKPGAGKSTLMKFALQHAEGRRRPGGHAIISFFFNARGHDLERSTVGMYRSLLFQLLERLPQLEDILDTGDPRRVPDAPIEWTLDSLRNLFHLAISKLQHPVTCFVDALDECPEEEIRSMLEDFQEFVEHAASVDTKLYICFSSRHYPHIETIIGKTFIMDDEEGHNQDIQRYVHGKLSAARGRVGDRVRAEILRKASGVFIWAVLVVEILNKELARGRLFSVEERLETIPSKLGEVFKDILRRDTENMGDLLLCLQWILFSKRPLSREEFYFAMESGLAAGRDGPGRWDRQYITAEYMDQFVVSSSKGLAEVAETTARTKTVQFIHESVRDFLLKDGGFRELGYDLGGDLEGSSHERLKECCLVYCSASTTIGGHAIPDIISSEDADGFRRLSSGTVEEFPFLEYATENVFYHADAASRQSPQDSFLASFPLTSWVQLYTLVNTTDLRTTSHLPTRGGTINLLRLLSSMTLLYPLAANGCLELLKVFLLQPCDIWVKGGLHVYPVSAALARGHLAAARMLLRRETETCGQDFFSELRLGEKYALKYRGGRLVWAIMQDLVGYAEHLIKSNITLSSEPGLADSREALEVAAKMGHESIVRLMLQKAALLGLSQKSLQAALSAAAKHGYRSIVELLLGNGAEVGIGTIYMAPLSSAAGNGHEDIVRLLLERGAHVEGTTRAMAEGRVLTKTSLLHAVNNGHEPIVQLLVEHGADHGGRGSYMTPLSAAAENGLEHTVRFLLEAGADIDAREATGPTPLYWAVCSGHERIVKLLLQKGAAVDLTRDGDTPLMKAAYWGHESLVEVLLENGADTERRDSRGQTPLLTAIKSRQVSIVRLLLDEGRDKMERGHLDEALALAKRTSRSMRKLVEGRMESGERALPEYSIVERGGQHSSAGQTMGAGGTMGEISERSRTREDN